VLQEGVEGIRGKVLVSKSVDVKKWRFVNLRLWTVHPKYLDTVGLAALWREALLAQKVLMGKTRGYKNHPQLDRFKSHHEPVMAIGFYLYQVYEEGKKRSYNFKKEKIELVPKKIQKIKVSREWVMLERRQLAQKLKIRDPEKYRLLLKVKELELHPLFDYTSA
jgi:hypothetical protein